MAVDFLDAHVKRAGGGFVAVDPVFRLGLQLDGELFAFLRQRAGLRDEQAGDGFEITLGQVVADGALDLVNGGVTVDDPVRFVLLGDLFGLFEVCLLYTSDAADDSTEV